MDVSAAVAASGWQPLYLFAPVTIFAALFLEASNAATLALLEGYWGGNAITSRVRRIMVRNQLAHRRRHLKRRSRLTAEAFDAAEARMRLNGLPPKDVQFLRAIALNLPLDDEFDGDHYDRLFRRTSWRDYLDSGEGVALDAAARRSWDYPLPSRMQPTLLGNILAAMDSDYPPQAVNFDWGNLRKSFPEFTSLRDRLDLLCGVMVSSIMLAVLSVPLLAKWAGQYPRILVFLSLVGISWLAYRSMVATSRQLRSALQVAVSSATTASEVSNNKKAS